MRWQDLRAELLSDQAVANSLKEEFPYQQVADAILQVRARFHVTQAELAEMIGTSQSAIARAESGKHPIEVSLLRRISEALGVQYSIVFSQSEPDPNTPTSALAFVRASGRLAKMGS